MSEDGLLGRLYKNGEIIVEEHMSRTMYVIQSGKVNVVKMKEEGNHPCFAWGGYLRRMSL